jgi:hypothetical protein
VRQVLHKRFVVLVAGFSLAVVVPTGVAGVTAPCADAAEGDTVALVVDFGEVTELGPRPGDVETACVPWTDGFKGGYALRDAGFTMRFGPSGLLCAINEYPANGCGERTGQQYYYWSYWKAGPGESSWGYSTTGAATPIRAGVTEGWRFVKGAGSANDPRPRHAPDHEAICPVPPTPPAGDPAPPPIDVPDFVPPPSAGPVASTTTARSGDEPDSAAETLPPTTSSAVTSSTAPADGEVALSDATPTATSSSTGGVGGVVAIVSVIAVLLAATLWRMRRRADG